VIRKQSWIVIIALCTLSAADLPYAGKWKLNLEKSRHASSAKTIEFTQQDGDGFTIKIADLNAVCEAKFDGKDYPATGPTVPTGYTLAVKKIDGRTFEMIQKMNGKTLYTSTFQASADGKTLTQTDSADSTGEKVEALYDRQ